MPDELFRNAFNKHLRGNYEQAIRGFEAYIARFPNTALIPEAYYWLGESYYGAKDYAHAIKTFDVVIKQYPGDHRVAGALLKQSDAYLEFGERDRARFALIDVIKRFPDSIEARQAKDRVNQIK